MRVALAVVVAFALASAASGCGGSAGQGRTALDEVTVVLDWTPNTNHSGVYLARANRLYRDAGLDVRIIEPGDAGALQLLATGRADLAFAAQEELVPARAEGVPVVALAAVVQHNTSSLLALEGAGIRTPADLVGHTYGGFGGPLEKALVQELVRCSGGDPSKVRFAEVGDVDYRVGLQKRQYDFVWIYDGWDKIRLAELDGLDVSTIPFLDHTDCIPDWYTPLLATSESAIQKRPDLLKRFMAATSRGYRAAMARPDEAADALLESVPELDPDLVRRSARYLAGRYADDPRAWGHQDSAVWQRFTTFLADAGLTEGEINVDDAFTNQFLPAGPRGGAGG